MRGHDQVQKLHLKNGKIMIICSHYQSNSTIIIDIGCEHLKVTQNVSLLKNCQILLEITTGLIPNTFHVFWKSVTFKDIQNMLLEMTPIHSVFLEEAKITTVGLNVDLHLIMWSFS